MVNSVVEMEVSRAVVKARLLERALHGSNAWEMVYADMRVPVTRTITDTGVHFRADFPERCNLGEAERVVFLLHEGITVGSRPIDAPDVNGFSVEWSFDARVTTTLA